MDSPGLFLFLFCKVSDYDKNAENDGDDYKGIEFHIVFCLLVLFMSREGEGEITGGVRKWIGF